jgi:methionyl-tRNA synthetase
MAANFFITTAIDYTNGAPHIGHAYEKVLADVLARFHRLKGESVFFLTGVDQHGQKVQQSAEKQGVAPQQFVDGITEKFLALWEKLDVRYDRWAATTDPHHKACVGKILQRLKDEGQLYKATRAGYYSVRQEQFLTDKERGEDGQFGPEWGEVVFIEEENYLFRLAEHRDWLLGLIDARPELITPEFRRAELRNAVEKLSGDLTVSRPKSRLAWGIELPFDPDFVTYVWFDALVNYISFAPGYDPTPGADLSEFSKCWPAVHLIGKDILIPAHGVYWPIMLKALGFSDAQIPTLLVHGWWNISGTKMSKSLGNSVDPDALADRFGAEALRYYLMSDITTGRDSDFSEERLVSRFNSDLANSLGNLLNRSLSMAQKYRSGVLKKGCVAEGAASFESRLGWDQAIQSTQQHYEGFAVHLALQTVLGMATACNQLIDTEKPWSVAKHPDLADRLDAILYMLAESLRLIAILISPVLPKSARGIFDQLGVSAEFRLQDVRWGLLPEGHLLNSPVPLFPRIEAAE